MSISNPAALMARQYPLSPCGKSVTFSTWMVTSSGGGRHGFGKRNWIYSGIGRFGSAVKVGKLPLLR
jgi:hypothetical protein